VLAGVIYDAYNALVKADDFNELKEIVRRLAEAQERTDQRVAELAVAQRQTDQRVAELAVAQRQTDRRVAELAVAQRQTDQRVAELAVAQRQTEQRVAELAVAQQQTEQRLAKLTMVVQGLAVELGGLSRAVSYALENEAYRGLPRLLKERLGLEVVGRLMRREVEGEEINIFGEARRGDEVVLVVGEAKLQLDRGRSRASERARVFTQLRRKVEAVRRAYPGREVVAILVTHYARPVFIEEAKAQGVEVFQSYEW
jgi:predicted transcriptional regulator